MRTNNIDCISEPIKALKIASKKYWFFPFSSNFRLLSQPFTWFTIVGWSFCDTNFKTWSDRMERQQQRQREWWDRGRWISKKSIEIKFSNWPIMSCVPRRSLWMVEGRVVEKERKKVVEYTVNEFYIHFNDAVVLHRQILLQKISIAQLSPSSDRQRVMSSVTVSDHNTTSHIQNWFSFIFLSLRKLLCVPPFVHAVNEIYF